MTDAVNHPDHYTSHPSGIECLQITRWMNFNVGNAFKYCWRAPYKGKRFEDLKKAVFYIDDEIRRPVRIGVDFRVEGLAPEAEKFEMWFNNQSQITEDKTLRLLYDAAFFQNERNGYREELQLARAVLSRHLLAVGE